MRAFLGINEDGRVLFGVAESIDDFIIMAKLSNMNNIRTVDVTDIVLSQNTTAIELDPSKMGVER
ncbi:hypothetical protein [Thermococcus sp.]